MKKDKQIEALNEIFKRFGSKSVVYFNDEPNEEENTMKFKNINWFCNECNAFLNAQDNFNSNKCIWECQNCGHQNRISRDNILSEEEADLLFDHPFVSAADYTMENYKEFDALRDDFYAEDEDDEYEDEDAYEDEDD